MELNTPHVMTLRRNDNYAVSILRTDPSVDMTGEAWAVDWYDVKRPLLHRWHLLAKKRLLRKHHAQMMVQLSLSKVLVPHVELERNFLSLTKFMDFQAVMKLYSSRMFRNILVMQSGTNHRSFGLVRKLDNGTLTDSLVPNVSGKLIYMVHIFRGSQMHPSAESLKDLASQFDVFTEFIGTRSGLLGVEEGKEPLRTFEFDLYGVLVFSAFEACQFDDLLQSEPYENFKSLSSDHFLGLFERPSR